MQSHSSASTAVMATLTHTSIAPSSRLDLRARRASTASASATSAGATHARRPASRTSAAAASRRSCRGRSARRRRRGAANSRAHARPMPADAPVMATTLPSRLIPRCCPYARPVKPVLIRQHVDTAPAALLAEWLEARGLAYEVHQTWVTPSVPDPADYAFIASLGHDRMAGDVWDPGVAAERELLDAGGGARRAGARPVLRRPGARGGARRRGRARRRCRSWAGAWSRPTMPR